MKRQAVTIGMLWVAMAVTGMAQAPPAAKHESRAAADQQEVQGLTNDVARMRALVQQMEMNLAFVQTTQTPLKHQFELETEMWRVVLDGMERRLQRLRGTSTGGVITPDTVLLGRDSKQAKP